MTTPIKIGNAQGFWGDRTDAAEELARQQPDLDVLTMDYLAEVSMSILARQRDRKPELGYPLDMVDAVRSLAPLWRERLGAGQPATPRLLTNGGGLNPVGCGEACAAVLRDAGLPGAKVAVVTGDDVLPWIRAQLAEDGSASVGDPAAVPVCPHLETGESIATVADRLETANAYLGAHAVVEALGHDPLVLITGRLADPSMAVAPCVHRFGWAWDDHDALAGATVAGHLIECGTQVTGGVATHWLDLPDPAHIGYPIVEVHEDGSCVATKPIGTGGLVDRRSVTEQLLYEIGDPDNYLSPDARVKFTSVQLEDVGENRVRVYSATGGPTTDSYKVSATYRDGYKAVGTLTIVGDRAYEKARKAGEVVLQRLADAGLTPEHSLIECVGAGEVVPVGEPDLSATEVTMRVGVRDARKEVCEYFAKQLVPLVTAGPQGTTGYAAGRPRVQEVFGYWPCLVPRSAVETTVHVFEV